MSGWIWISFPEVLKIHQEQLAVFGGGTGLRDKRLLESALTRPQQIANYKDSNEIDVATLAVAYAYGVIRNHPFVDGNKRVGFILLELFLELNGWELTATDEACINTIIAMAAGEIVESEFVALTREHMQATL